MMIVRTSLPISNAGLEEPQFALEMGLIMLNIRDNHIDRYDVYIGGFQVAFEPCHFDQDHITKKTKKFMLLLPNPTPDLYSYKNFHGLVNLRTRRGWICHCRLVSDMPNADGVGYTLWEIWETRCDSPRIDGVVIKEEGTVELIRGVEAWLVKNQLRCDLGGEFSEEFYTE